MVTGISKFPSRTTWMVAGQNLPKLLERAREPVRGSSLYCFLAGIGAMNRFSFEAPSGETRRLESRPLRRRGHFGSVGRGFLHGLNFHPPRRAPETDRAFIGS